MENEFIINPLIFYFIDIAENIKFLGVMGGIFVTAFSSIAYFAVWQNDDGRHEEENAKYYKSIKVGFFVGMIGLFLAIFVPSQKTCYKMMIARYTTKANIDSSVNFILDATDKVIERINKKSR